MNAIAAAGDAPTWSWIVGVSLPIFVSLIIFLFKQLWSKSEANAKALADYKLEIARDTLRREDFQSFRAELLDTMHRFETNLAERVYGLETRERDRANPRK